MLNVKVKMLICIDERYFPQQTLIGIKGQGEMKIQKGVPRIDVDK